MTELHRPLPAVGDRVHREHTQWYPGWTGKVISVDSVDIWCKVYDRKAKAWKDRRISRLEWEDCLAYIVKR